MSFIPYLSSVLPIWIPNSMCFTQHLSSGNMSLNFSDNSRVAVNLCNLILLLLALFFIFFSSFHSTNCYIVSPAKSAFFVVDLCASEFSFQCRYNIAAIRKDEWVLKLLGIFSFGLSKWHKLNREKVFILSASISVISPIVGWFLYCCP